MACFIGKSGQLQIRNFIKALSFKLHQSSFLQSIVLQHRQPPNLHGSYFIWLCVTSSRLLTNHTHLMLKPNNGFWAPFDHNTLLGTCSLLHGSPSSSAPPPCGGTSNYMGAHKDDWIITLAQFAVDQNNHKEGKHLRYVRVVGASHTTVSSILYHITLEAVDANRPKDLPCSCLVADIKELHGVACVEPC